MSHGTVKPMSKRLIALCVAATVAVSLVPTVADAHIRLTSPVPRSNADGLKPPTYPPPCGNVAAGGVKAVYKPGATVNVKWVETIGHAGCFQIGFSSDGTNFTVLKQINDPTGDVGNGLAFNTDVTLPAGVKCDKCTLQLRQLMLESATVKTCVANQVPPSGGANQGNTYYSCADVMVTDDPDASVPPDPDAGADGGSSGSSGSSGTSGTSGGPDEPGDDAGPSSSGNNGAPSAPRPTKKSDDGGCTMTPGDATTGAFGLAMAGLFGIAMIRRRRK